MATRQRYVLTASPLAAALMLAACQPQSAAPPADMAPLSTRGVANGFLAQAFAAGDPRGAYERFASADFKQHDPEIAEGLA